MRRIIKSTRSSTLIVLAIATMSVSLGFACQSSKPDAPRQRGGGAAGDGLEVDGVTFEDKVGDFFQDNCVSCHDGASSSSDPDLTSYVQAKRAAKAILREMEDGEMPPSGKVRKKDIDLIKRWIKLKTPKRDEDAEDDDDDDDEDDDDGSTDDGDGGDTNASFSYEGWLKGKIDTDCIACHAPNKDYPDLSSFENVSTRAASILLEIESGRMPKGLSPWNQAAIDKLKQWIAAGKPRADANVGAELTYDNGMKAWFDKYCVSCHGATPPNLSTKEAAQAAAEVSLSSVQASRMPKFAPISDQNEINKLRDWIAGGKK